MMPLSHFLTHGTPEPKSKTVQSAFDGVLLDGMKRLETSAGFHDFLSDKAERITFWREGLGPWNGLRFRHGGRDIIIAVPRKADGFGASIWLDKRLTFKAAVAAVMARLPSANRQAGLPQFMTETGRRTTLR